MLNTSTYDRSVAAAQLVEAACCAQEGDSESAKFHIRRALAQIDGFQVSHVSNTCLPQRERPSIPRGGLAHWQVRRVAAYVDANLAGRLSIIKLAKSLNLSTSHFSRAFKCTVGLSPHAWVLRRRMEVAQGLLLTTSAKLSDVAIMCGMTDQSHLTRRFRRTFGETPRVWRRSRRAILEERSTSWLSSVHDSYGRREAISESPLSADEHRM